MALAPEKQRRIEALTGKFATTSQTNRENLLALILRFFSALVNPYAGPEAKVYVDQVVGATRRAQLSQMALSSAFMARVLTEMGVSTKPVSLLLPDAPRGVDPAEVAARALRAYRIADSGGADTAESRRLALLQALVAADSDLTLAEREGYRQRLEPVTDVTGYRRIIHPEMSTSGVCGLCVAAADRKYRVGDLLPIHDRCHCSVLPIVGEKDPGHDLNQADLKQLYELAGSTAGKKSSTAKRDLTKVRYRVADHGELGSYLYSNSRGGGDPAAEIATRTEEPHAEAS